MNGSLSLDKTFDGMCDVLLFCDAIVGHTLTVVQSAYMYLWSVSNCDKEA